MYMACKHGKAVDVLHCFGDQVRGFFYFYKGGGGDATLSLTVHEWHLEYEFRFENWCEYSLVDLFSLN